MSDRDSHWTRLRTQLPVELLDLCEHAIGTEGAHCLRPRCGREASAQICIGKELIDALGEHANIAGLDHETAHTVVDGVWNSSDRRCNRWRASRHRFEHTH